MDGQQAEERENEKWEQVKDWVMGTDRARVDVSFSSYFSFSWHASSPVPRPFSSF